MHIHGLGSVPSPRANSPLPANSPPAEPKRPEDRVEISADTPVEDGQAPDVRALRLAQIKAAIEAGEYETQDKLDAALSRLFEEIGLDDEEES